MVSILAVLACYYNFYVDGLAFLQQTQEAQIAK